MNQVRGLKPPTDPTENRLRTRARHEPPRMHTPSPARSEPVRCGWVPPDKPDYALYHDTEWGVPVHDDRKLFEMLILEGAQAGLSWYTILKRREGYRAAFDGFDPANVARFSDARLERILREGDVIRNRQKIFSTRENAKVFLKIQKETGSFDAYLWAYVDGVPLVNRPKSHRDIVPTSPVSDAISKDLKKRGMSFVGSTIIYAYMQAVGVVDDHAVTCFRCTPPATHSVDKKTTPRRVAPRGR